MQQSTPTVKIEAIVTPNDAPAAINSPATTIGVFSKKRMRASRSRKPSTEDVADRVCPSAPKKKVQFRDPTCAHSGMAMPMIINFDVTIQIDH